MKPKIGIKSMKFMWKNVSHLWKSEYASKRKFYFFYTGGGSYQDFGFSDLWHVQKHFYFYKWCFLTVKYVRKAPFQRLRCL